MTANWMSGYVSDVAYTLGFYRELVPTFLNFACLANGVEGPPLDRPIRYCELGCGRGYGTILLAAANPESEFVGIDFNPSHIAEAQALATRAGLSNIAFHELSFADAARIQTGDFAEFDVVALHGVYTWVERSVRKDIIEFVRQKLKSGGLLFASYNCMPGWANVAPIQRLLMEVDQRSTRQSIAVLNEGMSLLGKLVEQPIALTNQNPGLKARIERMTKQDRNYLVHEFLNSGWEPLYVTDVMNDFAEAKLTYVGSASLPENRLDLCVPKHLRSLVQDAPDVAMRELLKDYIVNKQFRRDIYVKGLQSLSPREQLARFRKTLFVPGGADTSGMGKFQLPVGEITIKTADIQALMSRMTGQPAEGADLIAMLEQLGYKASEAVLIIILLIHASAIAPARPDAAVNTAPSAKLNATLLEMAAEADTHRFLASPVLGSALAFPFIDRIAVLAMLRIKGAKAAGDHDLAKYAFEALAASGQHFRRDGKVLEASDSNLAEIARIIGEFRTQRLPRWKLWGLLGQQ